jgi:hypothetical protein
MDRDSRLRAQLEPLDAALMAAAQAGADADLEQARAKGKAAARARAVMQEARTEGERAAARAASRRLVDGRRRARQLVLAAERASYDELVAESVAAAEGLRGRPEYGDLATRLAEIARRVLGEDAKIEHEPDGHAGLRASSKARTLDLTLATLARRCVERMGEQVTRLWA